MMFLNRRGSATVFLGIILPVIISACVMLTDVYIYDSGKRLAQNSIDASAYSVLGKYSGFLKENYDLYAYCLSDETAESIVMESLTKNLGDESIYDFKIENIEIIKEKNFADVFTMLGMIEKIAADDVYKNLVDEFSERFDIISGFSGTAEIIALKMKFDKSYQKIKDSMNSLTQIINGGEGIGYYVNRAGVDAEFTNAVEMFNNCIWQMNTIRLQISELTAELQKEPSEKVTVLEMMKEQLGQLQVDAADIYSSFIEGFIDGLKQANEEAINHISDIIKENENIHIISRSIKSSVEKIDDCPAYLKEIIYTCSDLMSDIEDAFIEQVFEEIKIEIEKNISGLNKLEDIFNKSVEEGDTDNIQEDTLSGYNAGIVFLYKEEAVAGTEDDRRSFFEEMGKKVLEKQTVKDICISEEKILPSVNAQKDQVGFDVTTTGSETVSGEVKINEMAESVKQTEPGFAGTMALDEYILDHFSYKNTDRKEELPETFFANEVEYILWGNESQNLNNFYTKAALMSTRFALDAIHVYTDADKTAKANVIATATAGWWTMGAGIPVMSNLIKLAWAVAEAGIDTKKLWNGESIAIVKSPAEWITDIGVGAAGVSIPGFLKMDYNDYLRLYLLTIPSEKKILRMMDLILLNSPENFNIYDAFTAVTIKALISYRSMTGGRHEIELSVTRSY